MKKIILGIILLILLKILLPIKPYVELNHLKIIEEIEITCNEDYEVTLIEKVPKKEDNGINYTKKVYKKKVKNLNELKEDKTLYLKKAKVKVKNCKKIKGSI